MTRISTISSFLLFLAIAATLAYWISEWTAPSPRAVSSPPKTEHVHTPVSAAANLFGGRSDVGSLANIQLRGVVHSGRASDSVAIIVVEGKPPRALKLNSEIAPGVKIKQILNKTVVVSQQGAERELSLPVFTAQESTGTSQPVASTPTHVPQASSPAAMSPGPVSSGGTQGVNTQGAANALGATSQGSSGVQGGGMVSSPERSRIPTQGLPAAPPTGAGSVPPSR